MDTQKAQLSSDGEVMTDKQIRDVVTPYEFGVSDDVIGTRLARPFRRGAALLIDLFLVVMLTDLPSILLASVGVVFFWRAGKKKNASPRFSWLRKTMKGIAAIILFGILIAVFDGMNAPQNNRLPGLDEDGTILTGTQGLELAALMIGLSGKLEKLDNDISQQRCVPYECWQEMLDTMAENLEERQFPPEIIDEIVEELEPEMQSSLSQEQTAALLSTFSQQLAAAPDADEPQDVSSEPEDIYPASQSDSSVPLNDNGDPSLLAWARGLLEDLGIGFGWAALYFTACTYWMKGQTPGKWLFGLKVIKLDGTTMTLWESFERYGGYGAGLATGLLGFAQIFWEPNRQAIHDKISETLVIRLGMDKVDVQAITAYHNNARRDDGSGESA